MKQIVSVLALGILVLACGHPADKAASHGAQQRVADSHPSTSSTHSSGVWGLDIASQRNTVDLLLATSIGENELRLLHQRSLDGGRSWSAPGTVPVFDFELAPGHRGTDPQIAASGDTVVVAWTARGGSAWGTGPIGVSISHDGGQSWEAGETPADDGENEIGHGFLDLATTSDGRFHAVWLDGRDGAGQGLRFASSSDAQSWSANATIDEATCECCWNRFLVDGDDLSVIYRDASPRDLRVATTADDGATRRDRGSPGAFDWAIDGCPHVGGALARSGDSLAALAWTGKEESVGLYVATLSTARSAPEWREPVRLGGRSARHGDLAVHGNRLFTVWDETEDGASSIFAAHSDDEGRSWSQPERIPQTDGGTHPLAVAVDDGVFAVWTAEGDGGATWRSVLIGTQFAP